MDLDKNNILRQKKSKYGLVPFLFGTGNVAERAGGMRA